MFFLCVEMQKRKIIRLTGSFCHKWQKFRLTPVIFLISRGTKIQKRHQVAQARLFKNRQTKRTWMPFNFGSPLIIPSTKEVARKSKIFSLRSARYIGGRALGLVSAGLFRAGLRGSVTRVGLRWSMTLARLRWSMTLAGLRWSVARVGLRWSVARVVLCGSVSGWSPAGL